jgi:hypothetical protein
MPVPRTILTGSDCFMFMGHNLATGKGRDEGLCFLIGFTLANGILLPVIGI